MGTHQTLVRLVDFMCEQMNGSFRESGMSVPPWRKNKAILSKWFLPTATSSTTRRRLLLAGAHEPEAQEAGLGKEDELRPGVGGGSRRRRRLLRRGGATEEIAEARPPPPPARERRERKKKTQTLNARRGTG